MPRFRLWSDVHTEFGPLDYKKKDDDKDTILLLAGDIGVGRGAEPFIEQLCNEFKYVVLICGNHEFYNYNYQWVIEKWKDIEERIPNLHFLNNRVAYLDGARIIGGTMWTGFDNNNEQVMNYCELRMNDFGGIKFNDAFFTAKHAAQLHSEFVEFLTDELKKEHDGPTIVMTHHSPADYKKLEKTYHPKENIINYAYYANVESVIENNVIDLWVHGHAHVNYDYKIGETTVISNPRGYYGYRLNPDFDDDYIIEIED